MATFLDQGVYSHFSVIFAFLLIFVVVFAILEAKKILGDHKGLNALAAFSVAGLFLLVRPAVAVVSIAAPYFVILFIVLFLIIVALSVMGITGDQIVSTITSKEYNFIIYFIVIFGILIVMLVLGQVFGQSLLTGNTGPLVSSDKLNTSTSSSAITSSNSFEQNMYNTIFHPKVLGFIFLLIIASFAIRMLASKVRD